MAYSRMAWSFCSIPSHRPELHFIDSEGKTVSKRGSTLTNLQALQRDHHLDYVPMVPANLQHADVQIGGVSVDRVDALDVEAFVKELGF